MELNRKDNDLILMCEFYQAENVQMLIENKIDVNWKKTIKGGTPFIACAVFNPKTIKKPLSNF
jgi:hypothetical protein